MIQTLKQATYKHGYLIITAAWLYTISFIFTNYWTYSASPEKVQQTLETYLQKQEEKFNQLTKDTTTLKAIYSKGGNKVKQALVNEVSGIFAYVIDDNGYPEEVYWNTFKMSVNGSDLDKPDGSYNAVYQNGFFQLIKHSFQKDGRTHILITLIPIHWDYFIENKYLHKEFANYPNIENLYAISEDGTGIPIHDAANEVVFHLKQKDAVSFDQPDTWSIALRVLAMLFLMAFINGLASEAVRERGFFTGYLFLVTVIVITRICTYYFPFPFDFRKLELFDPAIYASSSIHPSLGDLLVNSVLLFWAAVFFKYRYPPLQQLAPARSIEEKTGRWKKYAAIACLIVLPLITFGFADVVSSLVIDSKISFDVTNFFSLSAYTFISFIILSFIMYAYFHLSHILIIPSVKASLNFYNRLVIVAASGLFMLTFQIGTPAIIVRVMILAWLLVYMFILEYRQRDIVHSLVQSAFFLFWLMFFASSITVLIIVQNTKVELEQRKKIAEKLTYQTDPSGESLMNIAISNIDDSFINSNFDRFRSEYSNKYIKDSLINENFSGYLNKYDTRVYTYDSAYRPLYNDDSTYFHVIKHIIESEGKLTSIPHLYYYENSQDLFSYLYEKTVLGKDSTIQGYVFVIAKPKPYKSESLYPELFKQVTDIASDLNTNYAYAVYSKSKLINSFNDYGFSSAVAPADMPRLEFEERVKGDYSELWYNAGHNKVVVVVKKNDRFVETVTLFAYLFCVFLAVVVLFHIASFMIGVRFKWNSIKEIFHFNIRTQIHIIIIFVSLFSFVVIGIATISFFIVRFDRNNEERLTKAIQLMAAEMVTIRDKYVDDDVPTLNYLGSTGGDLERKIIEISEIHNVDVNVYDANGNLTVSTQPYIYNKHVLSTKMEPRAFYALNYEKQTQKIQTETVDNFSFLSIYVPVKFKDGHTYAYINIPYLNSQSELNQEISNFLLTLINLNVFIFVLAGAIAMLITNRITSSFTLIGEKMREISLGKMNEAIVWTRNDEIGALVIEYNKMVQKLEESAQGLARSEREGAWREMARQVAHEIKNPLTPMKLSIQYLQKAINSGHPNVKQLSEQVADTLVEQIEQLAKIAGDFSQFANIGNVTPEHFDISEVISTLTKLYNTDSSLHIDWQKTSTGTDYILADKVQVNRLFTNLIKNAIEASSEHESVDITVRQYRQDDRVVVAIIDNGTGIPKDMQDKIFTPNFTTKSSGTGLGLAICKGIVEKANGNIWFETKEEKGTAFYVVFPIDEVG
ncbi:His Kinase A (phospho-acceptor) domain-containing protein [Filimonas lacunae]|uniref:histidine kinase n=1 Tax=Filimonas lacunae TaxID=477680 RepID=A0A173MAX9_9BACT|nr:HAMP domain-containing sensor histidine kinase [Filimonas lacunae]BAV04705.1 nitrogen regulation protein NtrY [Filimonas lacunae]SIT32332.1 His Kinase A (phospho-acceptor) domain-containing protein [Filimonas lacunae]